MDAASRQRALDSLAQSFPGIDRSVLGVLLDEARGDVQQVRATLVANTTTVAPPRDSKPAPSAYGSLNVLDLGAQSADKLSVASTAAYYYSPLPLSPPQKASATDSGKASAQEGFFSSLSASLFGSPAPPPVTLSFAQKRHFLDTGFLVVPGAVPQPLLDVALSHINRSLGKGFGAHQVEAFRKLSWCPDIAGQPVISDLYNNSLAPAIVSALLGKHHPVYGGQIALRFPGDGCVENNDSVMDKVFGVEARHSHFRPVSSWASGWHIDGLPSRKHNVPLGEARNFSLLVGVFLKDVPDAYSGNLAVFPGTHLMIQNYFNNHGGVRKVLSRESASPERVVLPHDDPELRVPEPVQITGRAGDVVIVHYQSAHSIAPNCSPNIRYVVYFRVNSIAHKPGTFRPESMSNIWLDFDGVRDLTGAPRPTAP